MAHLRNLLSVLLGLIACTAIFSILAMTAMFVWPDYAVHGQRWLDQRIFSFTPIMACLNLAFWAFAFALAGWMTAIIAAHNRAAWVTAGFMLLRAAYVHLYSEWSTFPWWYNVVLVGSVLPMALLGSGLGTVRARTLQVSTA
jgi:hypothetical protein